MQAGAWRPAAGLWMDVGAIVEYPVQTIGVWVWASNCMEKEPIDWTGRPIDWVPVAGCGLGRWRRSRSVTAAGASSQPLLVAGRRALNQPRQSPSNEEGKKTRVDRSMFPLTCAVSGSARFPFGRTHGSRNFSLCWMMTVGTHPIERLSIACRNPKDSSGVAPHGRERLFPPQCMAPLHTPRPARHGRLLIRSRPGFGGFGWLRLLRPWPATTPLACPPLLVG